ncbi:MAG: hypothetical protein Q9200_002520 [Gallowayella weberi]
MYLIKKLQVYLYLRKYNYKDDKRRCAPVGFTPPYPPDRPTDDPRRVWEPNEYDREGSPQPSHPLWRRFWSDPEARPRDPGESFLIEPGITRAKPLESDGLSQGERAILKMKEDKEYEELLHICKWSKIHNEEIWEQERRWHAGMHAAMLKKPTEEEEQAAREERDNQTNRAIMVLLGSAALWARLGVDSSVRVGGPAIPCFQKTFPLSRTFSRMLQALEDPAIYRMGSATGYCLKTLI